MSVYCDWLGGCTFLSFLRAFEKICWWRYPGNVTLPDFSCFTSQKMVARYLFYMNVRPHYMSKPSVFRVLCSGKIRFLYGWNKIIIRRCETWRSTLTGPEPVFARCSRGDLLFLTPALTAHSGMQKLNCAQVPSLICVCVSKYAKSGCAGNRQKSKTAP